MQGEKALTKKVNEQKFKLFKYFHHPIKDLEGVPIGELEEIPTSTRTTGR